ncbi:nucleotidyltransferase domain-containing protein, partial [Alcanivorax sp.]|uniref:nucleotidyltransferase family protein n=1 Tax=Alcanivorax sp. TaxID=1872427 RepID=UPI002586CF6B
MDVTFGLSQTLLARLHGLFRRYPEVCRVEIFGSRAREEASGASDIDLVVFAPHISNQRFAQLWSDVVEGSDSVFKIDLLWWESLTNASLRQKIRQEARPFYP